MREATSRQDVSLSGMTRIDRPHESGVPKTESAASIPESPVAEQIQVQADQLAAHLRARQKELDHREVN